jgi:hypothetical protein
MLRKIFKVIFIAVSIFIVISVLVNTYNNNPQFILKKLSQDVLAVSSDKFKGHTDWLWREGRKFSFDIIYMNVFCAGEAKLFIKEEKQIPAFIIKAEVGPNDFLKRLYDAKMVITSTVDANNKISLIYDELSQTPEEKRSKEIIFNPVARIAQREGIKFKIPDYTYDPLSAFFNLLDAEFKIGKPIILNSLSKEEIYEFKATPVQLQGGIYKLEGEVHRQDKSSTHGARFTIWVKDANMRIPLLMRVVSAAGPIYVRLREVK